MNNKLTIVTEHNQEALCSAIPWDTAWCDSLGRVETPYALISNKEGLRLAKRVGKKWTQSCVDFVTGAKAHRRKFGGGKGQSIAKAVGLNKVSSLTVVDATAGMGGDAFVLASLGCKVTMIERCPVVRMLLADGLARGCAYAETEDAELFAILQRMQLVDGDSLTQIPLLDKAQTQVIYLDPMFPERKKSAQVKKEMQFFHDIVGDDNDADGLLDAALKKAVNRVVVKRPRIAPYLAGIAPGYQLVGKSGRFDVYPIRAF